MNEWTVPSRKWFAAQITAISALAVMWVTTGAWDQEESIAAIGLVTQGALSYLIPNQERSSWGDDERGLTLLETVVVLLVIGLFALAVIVLT